jgi:hypothetical protein
MLGIYPSKLKLPKISPDELLVITFLRDTDNSQTFRAKVVSKIKDRDAKNHQTLKFLCVLGNNDYNGILTYQELSDIIEEQHTAKEEGTQESWTSKSMTDHQGPMARKHKDYKGSSFNVLVKWEDGSETYEPLDIIMKDDPIRVAQYAQHRGSLDTPGWNKLKRFVKNKKMFTRMVKQVKLRSQRDVPIYQFGIRVPYNVKEALAFEETNGNHLWKEAMKANSAGLHEYDTFEDMGKGIQLPGYKKIHTNFKFSVKHDLRHKGRMVADGHLKEASH